MAVAHVIGKRNVLLQRRAVLVLASPRLDSVERIAVVENLDVNESHKREEARGTRRAESYERMKSVLIGEVDLNTVSTVAYLHNT